MTKYTDFTYSPLIQGYDASLWKTIYGSPAISGSQLELSNAQIIHYGNILRGDVTFSVTFPIAPAAELSGLTFGLYNPNNNAYAYFTVNSAGSLLASIKDGDSASASSSSAITWNSNWTSVSTDFRIKWEAGMVRFYIEGVNVTTLYESATDWSASSEDYIHYVPTVPLSIYFSNPSARSFLVKYITAKSIQAYYQAPDVEGAVSLGTNVFKWENITVVENVAIFLPELSLGGINANFDAVSAAEAVTMLLYALPAVNDAVTVTESLSFLYQQLNAEVNDAITVVEDIALTVV